MTKCTAKATQSKSDLLKDKTVALKNKTVALADVRCTNGTEAMEWPPIFDATVATRIMDAGRSSPAKQRARMPARKESRIPAAQEKSTMPTQTTTVLEAAVVGAVEWSQWQM